MSLNTNGGPFGRMKNPEGKSRRTVKTGGGKIFRMVSCICAAAVSSATGGTVTVDAFSFVTNYVETGMAVTESSKMLLSGEGEMVKTGGGDWIIPLSLLPQPWSAAFAVKEGSLVLDMTSAEAGAAPSDLPEQIKAKALLWVDASDPVASHIDGDNGQVSVWYDRREGEDVSSPSYCRAQSYTGLTNEIPSFVTLGGITNAVYFGGYGSGQAMEFLLPSGSRYSESSSTKSVKHVFAVHIPVDSYGTLFGTFTFTSSAFKKDSSHTDPLKNYYWESGTTWPAMSNGRTYLDGERIDGSLTEFRKCIQVLEGERFYNANAATHGFFAGRTAEFAGGDYICEALVFTNRLTESERLVITEYLMRKWKPETAARKLSVDVKAGTSFKADAGDGEADLAGVAFTGNGTLDMADVADVTIANADSKVFDGTLVPGDGTVTLRSPVAVALPQAGRITVTNTVSGPELTVSADSGAALYKDGRERVVVRSVPQTLHKVDVEEGTLSILSPVPANVRDEYVRIPVVNGGFEDYASDISELEEGKGVLSNAEITNAGRGWRYVWTRGSGYVMDWWRWTGEGIDRAPRSAWHFYTPPPEGNCALVLRAGSEDDAVVRGEALYLEAGTYELRFWLGGRQAERYLGQIFSPRLVDGETSDLKAKFGDVMYTDLTQYKEVRLRARVAESGSYRLEFRSLGPRLGIIIVDDVKLYKVIPSFFTASEWKIPGGDFETDTLPWISGIKRFTTEHTHTNWTFAQSASWAGGCAEVGITTICTTNNPSDYGSGVFYNDSRRPATGSMELCFRKNDASAVTVFTPPAGRWVLQGDLAQFGSYGCSPKIKASVTIGGAVTDLGTIPAKTRLMKRFAWPVSFVTDGSQEVTLTLTATGVASGENSSAHGLLADDLVLAGATDVDLMKDGNCESWSSFLLSHTSSVFGGLSGQCRSRRPGDAPAAFGTTVIQGEYMKTIENLSALYEDVYFPFPGRYRLSFYTHSRLNDKGTGNYGPNPLRAWIASGGVTNVIGHADTYNSEWIQRVFDFDVPSAGVWRVALQGCDNPENEKHIHEAHVDAITIRQIPVAPLMTPPFPKDCRISVAEGARLEVGFSGTNTVRGLRLGNTRLKGIVDVADHPGYLSGSGTFKVVPWGTVISLR